MPTVLSRKPGGSGGGGAPSGPAGGSLDGTYPNPGIADDAVDTAQIADDAVEAAQIAAGAVGRAELATGIGVYDLLFDSTLGGAGVFDFTPIAGTYKHLHLVMQLRATNAGAVIVYVTLNNDSSAIYYTESLQSVNTGNTAAAAVAQTAARVGSCPGSSDTAGRAAGMVVDIPNYAATTFHKPVIGHGGRSTSNVVGGQVMDIAYNEYASTSAITRVAIAPSAGTTFVTGSRATLYGLG